MKKLNTLHNENLKTLLREKIVFVYGIAIIFIILSGLFSVSKEYLYQENMEISDGTEWRFFIEDTKLSNESISTMIKKYIGADVSKRNTIDVQDQFIVEKIKRVYGENWNTLENANKKFFGERAKLIESQDSVKTPTLQSLQDGYVEGWKVIDTLFPQTLYLIWLFIMLMSIPIYHKSKRSGFHEINISTKYGKDQINKINWINAYELSTGMFIFGIVLLYLFVWSRYSLNGYHLNIQTIPKYFLATTSWSIYKTFMMQILIAYIETLVIVNISLIISILSKSVKVGYGLMVLLGAWQFTLLKLFRNKSHMIFVNYLPSEIFKIENFIYVGIKLVLFLVLLFLISELILYGFIRKVKEHEYV